LRQHLGSCQRDVKRIRRRIRRTEALGSKSVAGGRELAEKVFDLGLWPELKPKLLPFCNAVRAGLGMPQIEDVLG
jgi:hypothetical protein